MKSRPCVALAPLLLVFFSCAGLSAPPVSSKLPPEDELSPVEALSKPDEAPDRPIFSLPRGLEIPAGYEFLPFSVELPAIPSSVGTLTRETGDALAQLEAAAKTRLRDAFREAYLDGLLRELPLSGVLGGDLVHSWPGQAGHSAWAQNWRLSRDYPTVWGIPNLTLALAAQDKDMVFLVHDAILDRYGRTGGLGGANGAAGYGAPLGNEFYYQGGKAQAFEYGLLVVDQGAAGRFIPQPPPVDTAAAAPAGDAPPGGVSPGISPQVTAAFRSALAGLPPALTAPDETVPETPAGLLVGLGELVPDTGIFYIPLAPDASAVDGHVTGLYLQSFNQATVFLVLADSSALPFRARLLTGPFLDALLVAPAQKLPGLAETAPQAALQAAAQQEPQGSPIRALLEGFALYGVALTDPLPRPLVEGEDLWGEAQRFSRGWILSRVD